MHIDLIKETQVIEYYTGGREDVIFIISLIRAEILRRKDNKHTNKDDDEA